MPTASRVRREFVQPRESATGTFGGDVFVITPSEIFAADHPMVRAFPHLFRPVRESRPAVEQATAAPGELRGESDLLAAYAEATGDKTATKAVRAPTVDKALRAPDSFK